MFLAWIICLQRNSKNNAHILQYSEIVNNDKEVSNILGVGAWQIHTCQVYLFYKWFIRTQHHCFDLLYSDP